MNQPHALSTEQPPLHYLYGAPISTATIRRQPSDFIVEETLSFTPTGQGEHVLLYVEKIGQNTQFIARQLAQAAGLKNRLVSYAGLKDRHAVTRQWFCLPWPIKQDLPWQDWQLDGATILQVTRHQRRLKIGSIAQNRFVLTLRDITAMDALLTRLDLVQLGVPNYYGEQRFGCNNSNLQSAARLFAGEGITDRQLRGLALSAARSMLFNQQVSQRIAAGLLNTLQPGAVVQLDGSGSVFHVPVVTEELAARLQQADIHPTAILPGVGKAMESDAALQSQRAWLSPYAAWEQALIDFNMHLERRAVRLMPKHLSFVVQGDTLELSFALPAGCFATAVLRELVNYQDVSREFRWLDDSADAATMES